MAAFSGRKLYHRIPGSRRIHTICRRRMRRSIMLIFLTTVAGLLYLNTGCKYGTGCEDNARPTADVYLKVVRPSLGRIPSVNVANVTCSKLFTADANETSNALFYSNKYPRLSIRDEDFVRQTFDCALFLGRRQYIMRPLTSEEEQFPVAFSIIMYRNVEQVEMLLRAIYRPQNIYCIHIDSSAKLNVTLAVKSIVRCFENVFIASKNVNVQWGTFSVVESELACMEDLLKRKRWKYFINLTGQEFPLKTNWELIQVLKTLNGSNVISGNIKGKNIRRIKWSYNGLAFRNKLLPPIPYNMTITKGPVHMVATREFISYVITDPVALTFRAWAEKTGVPDETFFSSLNHNPQLNIPGSYKGYPGISDQNAHIQRLKLWGHEGTCYGKHKRNTCVFGIKDLPKMHRSEKLFVNKLHLDFQPIALLCLEQELFRRVLSEVKGDLHFNVTYYRNMDYVRNHVPSDVNTKT